jgi:hypothetical protein
MADGSAQRYLDQIHSLARLETVAAEPQRYAELVAVEVPAEVALDALEAADATLASALAALDAMIARAMAIRIDHALAADTSLAPPSRKLFATTIVAYADRLPLLAERVRDVSARGGSRDADAVATLVVDAARSVLDLREQMRRELLALVATRAAAAVAEADRRARDRELGEAERRRWSAARRDLELVAAHPGVVAAAPMRARMAELPEQLDEPDPEPERSFADLIEMD